MARVAQHEARRRGHHLVARPSGRSTWFRRPRRRSGSPARSACWTHDLGSGVVHDVVTQRSQRTGDQPRHMDLRQAHSLGDLRLRVLPVETHQQDFAFALGSLCSAERTASRSSTYSRSGSVSPTKSPRPQRRPRPSGGPATSNSSPRRAPAWPAAPLPRPGRVHRPPQPESGPVHGPRSSSEALCTFSVASCRLRGTRERPTHGRGSDAATPRGWSARRRSGTRCPAPD